MIRPLLSDQTAESIDHREMERSERDAKGERRSSETDRERGNERGGA